FGADIHQQVFPLEVVAIQSLYRILHRRGELAVGAAELFEQHVAECRIGRVDAHGVHQLLHVVIHEPSSLFEWRARMTGAMAVEAMTATEVPRQPSTPRAVFADLKLQL